MATSETTKTIEEVNLPPNSPPPKLKSLTNAEKRNHTTPRDGTMQAGIAKIDLMEDWRVLRGDRS